MDQRKPVRSGLVVRQKVDLFLVWNVYSLVEMQIIMSLYNLKVKQLRKKSVFNWIKTTTKKTIAKAKGLLACILDQFN